MNTQQVVNGLHSGIKRLVCMGLAVFFPVGLVFGCTLFGAQGSRVQDGGAILVKNRDWRPEYQEMRLVQGTSYRFYGLYGDTKDGMALKGGVNEKGLAVFSASASVIPAVQRTAMGKKTGCIKRMLGTYATVEEAVNKTAAWGGPKFFVLADATELAYVEVGQNNQIVVKRQKNGTLAHTNFYLSPKFQQLNLKKGISARHRYARIEDLLASQHTPYQLDDLLAYSQDRSDGPDNSIWRVGSRSQGPQTIATFGVWLHTHAKPDVFVKVRQQPTDTGHETVYRWNGNQLFPDAPL